MANMVVAFVVIALVVAAVRNIIKRRNDGNDSCNGNCGCCGGCR